RSSIRASAARSRGRCRSYSTQIASGSRRTRRSASASDGPTLIEEERRAGNTRDSALQAPGAADAPQEPDAQHAREREAEHRTEVDPEEVRPVLGEDPDQARADQAAGDHHRDHEPVERDVELAHEVVEALVHEADLDLAVADLLEEVVHLERHVARAPGELDC